MKLLHEIKSIKSYFALMLEWHKCGTTVIEKPSVSDGGVVGTCICICVFVFVFLYLCICVFVFVYLCICASHGGN